LKQQRYSENRDKKRLFIKSYPPMWTVVVLDIGALRCWMAVVVYVGLFGFG